MTATQQQRTRVLTAIRYRPDTASGVAERLLIKEEAARSHLAQLHGRGRVHIARNDSGAATWAYGSRAGIAAREGR